MKRVLVTGASGFIGHHCLAPIAARGFKVHGVARNPPPEASSGITWHQADLLDAAAAQTLVHWIKPTHLLHLAWYVVPSKNIMAAVNFDWVASSMNLLTAFAACGGRRAVISGSSYEYDWDYGYCSERLTPTTPNTVYGSCKHALRLLAESFASSHDISLAWPRVFFLYGPHEHPDRLVSSVIRNLLLGRPAPCSHGRQVRDYLHVQDVAEALVSLLDNDTRGPMNIASGQPVTLGEIVLTIGRLLDRSDLIQLGAIPARSNDTPLVVGENARLRTELGWEQAFDLESGLRHTIQWWQAQAARPSP